MFGKASPQQMLEKAGRLGDRASEKHEPGTLIDVLEPLNHNADRWALSFVLHLSGAQARELASPTGENAVLSIQQGDVTIPVFLLRLNGRKDLSFACILRADLCGERKTEFESLDYFAIWNSLWSFDVYIYADGSQRGSFFIPNSTQNQIPDLAVKVKQCLIKPNGYSAFSTAGTSLKMSSRLSARSDFGGLTDSEKFGRSMWELYEKSGRK